MKDFVQVLVLRLFLCIPLAFLGWFLVAWTHRCIWTAGWLIADRGRSTAVITEVFQPKRSVAYQYTVNGKTYTGFDTYAEENGKYWKPSLGEKCTVYFSSSHPWLSSLQDKTELASGLPAVIVGLLMECFIVWMVINPRPLMRTGHKPSWQNYLRPN